MTAVVGILLDELRGLLSVEHDGTITWDELQELKNEYFGPDVVAIEVYPPHSNVVNSLPMRHLWRLGANEYWPDLTGQKAVGDLTLRDREILTRSEIEFHQQRKTDISCKISIDTDETVVDGFKEVLERSVPDRWSKLTAANEK
ncbi:DUF7694 domain-containing protein [Brucella rhizosphaerae]|uniref:DUF7694 domain-containing protein n=1 Tax=Brucella rhizosphaerae TaxID=571254 RepID=UPI0004676614|nr:hypothetical protein [Brucella rhizosphaerae]